MSSHLTMARITFGPLHEAEAAAEALKAKGYIVRVSPYDHENEATFAEAQRLVDDSEIDAADRRDYPDSPGGSTVLFEVTNIVGPFKGLVCDAGRIPKGHIPFEYDTPAWRGETD